jgi:2-methylaconitate cis-trans-isomerase PrpF
MDRDDISERLTSVWLDALDAGLDAEFIQDAIQTVVIAALELGVEGFQDYMDEDTEAIEETLTKKVNELLLTEIAKINGT